MTPVEDKAKELVDSFYEYTKDVGRCNYSSKACAILCCNEILTAIAENGVLYPHKEYEKAKDYWQQVKAYIEQL